MNFFEKLLTNFIGWFRRKTGSIETEEPKQIESPDKKKPSVSPRVKAFEKAFQIAIRYSNQGIEENKDKELIKEWWARIGKKGYTEKTPWCTLGIHIPLMEAGLLTKEQLPKKIALARGYLIDVPKGFKKIAVKDLEVGDIAVKWRGTTSTGGGPNGWMGHIGWFDGYTPDKKGYFSIGGNQQNKFNKKIYDTRKLLGGIRVVGDSFDSVEDEHNVDMSIDTSFISKKYVQRSLDMAEKFLLAKETRNSNDIKWALAKIRKHEDRYKKMGREFNIPWQAIAAIHYLESSVRFNRHLHNGDPLTARTVRKTANRPKHAPANGHTYTFEESAKDVLTDLIKRPKHWSLPNLVHYLERYNGMGYFKRGLNSPYLMAGTQFQQSGKYIKDGKFDPKASSKRAGAVILMKKLGYDPL